MSAEADRFALVLASLFQPIAVRYRDDYLNAVVVSFMRDAGMVLKQDIQDVVSEASTSPPHQSIAYVDCVEAIKAALAKALRALLKLKLGYTKSAATDIVTAALARWLDDRFSITSRRLLGWAAPKAGFWSLIHDLAPHFPGGPGPWTVNPRPSPSHSKHTASTRRS